MKWVWGGLFGATLLLSALPVGGAAQAVGADGTTVVPLHQALQADEDSGELKVSDILISVALLVLVFLFGLIIFNS